MTFLGTIILIGCALILLVFLVAFGPETFRYLRDEFPSVFSLPFVKLRKLWRAIEAKYKHLGLPPFSTILFFVAILSLYIIGTAIL
jgi:hypothetical protein